MVAPLGSRPSSAKDTPQSARRGRIPSLAPLDCIETFLQVADYGGILPAAQEAGVSESTVRRRVRRLEAFTGTPLFNADGNVHTLSAEGRTFLPMARAGLNVIMAAADRMLRWEEREIEVTTAPTFANRWLIPRIAKFERDNPGLLVNINGTSIRKPLNEWQGVAIRFADATADVPGGELLFHQKVVAISNRTFMQRHRIETPGDVARQPRLVSTFDQGNWDAWAAQAGVATADVPRTTILENNDLVIRAVLGGAGVGLAGIAFIQDDLLSGRLMKLPGPVIRTGKAWWVIRSGLSGDLGCDLVSWLKGQARAAGVR